MGDVSVPAGRGTSLAHLAQRQMSHELSRRIVMPTKKAPQVGDMFRCESCGFEVHVTKECKCSSGCAELVCCGKDMTNVTEPEVINK